MELPYRRGAGERHLKEGHAGDVIHRLRFEMSGGVIHRPAPGPEVLPGNGAGLRFAADQALEAVRVDVDEARQKGAAGQVDHRVGHRVGRDHADDPAIVTCQESAVRNKAAVDEKKVWAIESGHAATFCP